MSIAISGGPMPVLIAGQTVAHPAPLVSVPPIAQVAVVAAVAYPQQPAIAEDTAHRQQHGRQQGSSRERRERQRPDSPQHAGNLTEDTQLGLIVDREI